MKDDLRFEKTGFFNKTDRKAENLSTTGITQASTFKV